MKKLITLMTMAVLIGAAVWANPVTLTNKTNDTHCLSFNNWSDWLVLLPGETYTYDVDCNVDLIVFFDVETGVGQGKWPNFNEVCDNGVYELVWNENGIPSINPIDWEHAYITNELPEYGTIEDHTDELDNPAELVKAVNDMNKAGIEGQLTKKSTGTFYYIEHYIGNPDVVLQVTAKKGKVTKVTAAFLAY